jgi:5'-3' exonuclease
MRLKGVRLLLVDGPNMVRRIHAAIPASEIPELVEQTISSTLQSLQRAVKQHQPTHILCAFECGGPTWRHIRFPDYKKDRPPMPRELVEIFERLEQEINAIGIKVVSIEQMEADDVIASTATRAAAEGAAVLILSTDSGQAQLLGDRICQFNHFSQEEITAGTINNRFGVKPAQLVDYFALVGDSSHSLPGVPGIGKKTAAKLLADYPDLESIIAAADEIGGKTGESLKTHADTANLVRELSALRVDVELGVPLREFRVPDLSASAG